MAALREPDIAPGVTRNPNVSSFVPVSTPDQTSDFEEARAAQAADQANPQEAVALNLASYIRRCFREAEQHRLSSGVTERLIDCQRRRKGEYAPDRLEKIKAQGGNETYFNITKTKAVTLEAWLHDAMAPAGDNPWDIQATPIPSLSEKMNQQVIAGVVAGLKAMGVGPGTAPDPMMIQQFTMDLYDKTLELQVAEAKKRTERMKRQIEDQLTEGGFIKALMQFKIYFTTYPTAFLKGPILRKRKTLAYVDEEVTVTEELFHEWEAPNPQNVYPAPNARHIKDGPLCEKTHYGVKDLMDARGVEGWNTEEINRVLEKVTDQGTVVTMDLVTGETERATMENRDTTYYSGNAPNTVDAINFWGSVPVKLLREWGMQGLDSEQPNDYKDVHAVLCGVHVVRAILNPDKLGDINWSATSFEPEPDSVWGNGLPEEMKDCQDPYNAALRCMLDNLAIASGPQTAVDIDALAEGEDPREQYPRRVWLYNGSTIGNGTRKPVDWFQPQSNAEVLTTVGDYFELKGDERTRIPKYTHGETKVGGAGETASGLEMLMAAVDKGIKRLIGFIDEDIICTSVTRQYNWNMQFIEDANLKADARVRARGVQAAVEKTQVRLRRQEFLDRTANPIDMAIIGMKGRAAVLRASCDGLGLDPDTIVPSDEELMAQAQAALDAQQPPDGKEKPAEQGDAKPKEEKAPAA